VGTTQDFDYRAPLETPSWRPPLLLPPGGGILPPRRPGSVLASTASWALALTSTSAAPQVPGTGRSCWSRYAKSARRNSWTTGSRRTLAGRQERSASTSRLSDASRPAGAPRVPLDGPREEQLVSSVVDGRTRYFPVGVIDWSVAPDRAPPERPHQGIYDSSTANRRHPAEMAERAGISRPPRSGTCAPRGSGWSRTRAARDASTTTPTSRAPSEGPDHGKHGSPVG